MGLTESDETGEPKLNIIHPRWGTIKIKWEVMHTETQPKKCKLDTGTRDMTEWGDKRMKHREIIMGTGRDKHRDRD